MKKFNICKAYGLEWHGFKIKKGVAFGCDNDGRLWVCDMVSPDYKPYETLVMRRQNNNGDWLTIEETSDATRFIINLCRRKNIVICPSHRHFRNPYNKNTMYSLRPRERRPQTYVYRVRSIRAIDHGQQEQVTLATLGQDDFFGMDGYNGWSGYH